MVCTEKSFYFLGAEGSFESVPTTRPIVQSTGLLSTLIKFIINVEYFRLI